ncbi:hypothetical protein V8E36_001514 [Tilletia maclaganii]
MFFLQTLKHTINLHPSYFGPNMISYLEAKLRDEIEGSCSGRYGYIIRVLRIISSGQGVIKPSTGVAEFVMEYNAIVFKPFKGEVVDAVVTTVNKMGFFAEVGPLNMFVSSHLIPSDFNFAQNTNPPQYISQEKAEVIAKGTKVRLRIVGTRIDAAEIFAIATMKEDYLGPHATGTDVETS